MSSLQRVEGSKVIVVIVCCIHTVDHADLGGVQDVLHAVGVQGLRRDSEVPLSQLRTAVSELYTSLWTSHPALGSSQVQQAQELCLNWLMMAFQW